jgi:hypothetical protein
MDGNWKMFPENFKKFNVDSKHYCKPGLVAQAYNPATQETDTGWLEVN